MKYILNYNKITGEIIGFGTVTDDIPIETLQPEDINLDILFEPTKGPEYEYIKNGMLVEYTELQRLQKQNKPVTPFIPVWSNETFTWTINDPRTLAEQKQDKKIQITNLREQKNLEPITYQNSLFDCDEIAQRNVQAWVTTINAGTNPPQGFVWRDYNNVDHPADAAFIVGLNNQIVARGTQLYQTSWTKKAEVDALTTADEVKNYDVTAGW